VNDCCLNTALVSYNIASPQLYSLHQAMPRQPQSVRRGRAETIGDKIVFVTLILFDDNNLFPSSKWDFPSNLLRCWYAIWQNQSRVLATFDNSPPLWNHSRVYWRELITTVRTTRVKRDRFTKFRFINYIYLSDRGRPLIW